MKNIFLDIISAIKDIISAIKCSSLEFFKNISVPFQKYFINVDVIKVSVPFFGLFFSDLATLVLLLVYLFIVDFVSGLVKSYFYAKKNGIIIRKYITSRKMFSIFYQMFIVITLVNAFFIVDNYLFETILITKYILLMSIIQISYSILENIVEISILTNGNGKHNIFIIIKNGLDYIKNVLKTKK